MDENTLKSLYEALDDALYIYGRCLIEDIENAGLTEKLNCWHELTIEIADCIENNVL